MRNVLVVHHAGKDVAKGARGSSALRAAVDTEIVVKDKTATITKQRDGEEGAKVAFRLHPVPVGQNAKGELVEVPVAVPITMGEARRMRALQGGVAGASGIRPAGRSGRK